jgi:catechol 2,3-dioxygenase-like lactoylglutathione lyase family enzyme
MRFDHAIIAVFNLEAATADFEKLGFTVVYGGEHAGGLTHNALITFVDGTYLELMAPTNLELTVNPPEPGPGNYLFLFEGGEGFAGFALHTDELDAVVDRVREHGIEIADPASGGRLRTDGVELAWRTAFPLGSFSPFFITDENPRELRVRNDPELTSHANGALGTQRVLSVVSNLEVGTMRYSAMLAETPDRGSAIEGAETAKFNIGTFEATIAAPTTDPLSDHLESRGEGLYEIEIETNSLADSPGSLLVCGAHIKFVGIQKK